MFGVKKKNSLIISLLMIVVLTFSGLVVVFAGAEGNGSDYPAGYFGFCGGSNCMWAGRSGVRIALVDANGNKVSGTHHIDLWVMDQLRNTKNYDLYSDSGLIHNFDKAYYGSQIKQELLAGAAGLKVDTYFSLSNVHDMDSVLGLSSILGSANDPEALYTRGLSTPYGDWHPEWIQDVVDLIIDNTSNSDTRIVDNILAKLGYDVSNPAITAANNGYYLQYEPLVAHGRIGSDITNYIFIGTVTEYYKYDKGKAGILTPWFDGGSTSIYIDGSDMPSNFTNGTGTGVTNLLSKNASNKIYGEGVAHVWISDLFDTFTCSDAMDYINSKYTPGTEAYHDAVKKLRDGNFEYTDASGVKRVQSGPFSYYYLEKSVYTTLPGGKAACDNPESSSCQDAIDYINDNASAYPKGSTAYHEAVAQVKNKTFTYMIGGEIFKIDSSETTDYDFLERSWYELAGGKAACRDRGVCEFFETDNVHVDNCTNGKTYFKDIDNKEAWLTCGIAYIKDGVTYSSDNTGHEAVGGGVVGNSEYCEVFCYEELETQFPKSVSGIKAGQTFRWERSDGTFGSIKVNKKCSTKNYVAGSQGYLFDEWAADYKRNEKKLVKYYMKKAAYEEAKGEITTTSDFKYVACAGCPYTCGSGSSAYECDKRYRGKAEVDSQSHSYYHSYISTISGQSDDLSFTTGYDYETAAAAKSAAKTELKKILQTNADEEYAKYTGELLKESNLLEKIGQCTKNLKYDYKTAVRFTFSEPVNSVYGSNSRNFSFDGNLNVVGSYNESNVDTSSCSKKKVYTYTCSGVGSAATCSPVKKEVLDCSKVEWNINGTFKYQYPTDKFQWYSLKTNGTLLNQSQKGSEPESFFYSIGYGLPTAFSLTDGKYSLKVTVSNLGDNATTTGAQNYNKPNGHFAPLAEVVTTTSGTGYGFEYACTYEVENEIFGYDCQYDSHGKLTADSPEYCDAKSDKNSKGSLVGLDITFRLVTLLVDGDDINKAFPGVDGNGRLPKGNWRIGLDEIRKVLDADVYKNDMAMYEIMLDVNGIQRIRKDNEKYFDAGKDPYTSYYDANNAQKVYCATGDDQQKYCASTFISKLNTGSGYNYKLLGTCLPTSNTLGRAEYVLEHGCDSTYTYPTINWAR